MFRVLLTQTETLYPSLQTRILRTLTINDVCFQKMMRLVTGDENGFRKFLSLAFDNLIKYNNEILVLIIREYLSAYKNSSRAAPFQKWKQEINPFKKYSRVVVPKVSVHVRVTKLQIFCVLNRKCFQLENHGLE